MKAKANSYYMGKMGKDTNFYLYIDKYFEVGFGFSKEQAKATCGRHNHWLKQGNLLNIASDRLNPLGPTKLENK